MTINYNAIPVEAFYLYYYAIIFRLTDSIKTVIRRHMARATSPMEIDERHTHTVN